MSQDVRWDLCGDGNINPSAATEVTPSEPDGTYESFIEQEALFHNGDSGAQPHHGSTYWRKKGHQLSNWLSNLKKFSPHRFYRSYGKDRKLARNQVLSDVTGNRLSSSHPNVSHTNLTDFLDTGSYSACASLTSSPKRIQEAPFTPVSSPFLRRRPSLAASSIVTDSQSTDRQSGVLSLDNSRLVNDDVGDVLVGDADAASYRKHQQILLRQHPFYELDVFLQSGCDLVAKDSCGTSDPYVKFKIAGKLVHKSKTVQKNLNPQWNERFTIPIEDVFQSLSIKVFDYDWGFQDDFMGSTTFDLSSLEPCQPTSLKLELTEPGKSTIMGSVNIVFTLIPKSQEDKDQYFHRNARLADTSRRLKSQIWSNVVTIVLVEGKNLGTGINSATQKNSQLCPWVKFRLGNAKYKSKCCQRTSNPLWREQFDLHMFDDQSKSLEMLVLDGSRYWEDVIGRCNIDLTELEHEKTHRISKELDNKNGSVFLLLTISGTTSSETISDLSNYDCNIKYRDNFRKRYSLLNTLNNMKDIGHLTVKEAASQSYFEKSPQRVYEAHGLASADLGGKSDPFCVLELVNARLQTQTEYKTLSPSWQKIFTLYDNVKDVHSVLEVTVYDEDRDHKVEFLGKIAVPLLMITNGEKKWYALKDRKLTSYAKGQILLEMDVVYNPVRACVRTFYPREEKYMEQEEKFKKKIFVNNVLRVREMVKFFIDVANFIQSCWEWESPLRSTISFVVFLIVTYNFELYMSPFAFLLIFLYTYVRKYMWRTPSEEEEVDRFDDDDDDDDRDKEEKKTLKERLMAIQEVILSVQVALGKVASVWESVKNTFNFSVPFLSWLAIALLSIGVVALYFVPLRLIVIIWGVNKFTKKLRNPHSIPNNEVLDFLTRVPNDVNLLMYKELKIVGPSESDRKGHRKKKSC